MATSAVIRSWKSKTSRERAVEMLGPEVRAGAAVDQLRRDPEPLAGPPDAAPQHVADPELPRDLRARRRRGPV